MHAISNLPKPDIFSPKLDSSMLKPLVARQLELRDGGIRAVCIPMFGILIPIGTGLWGPVGPTLLTFWIGQLWFIAVAAATWHGNRFLYLRHRQSNTWFKHPARRIAQMLLAIVFYTVPCCVSMLWAWYWFTGLPVDWAAIRLATATSVICVIFITHVYETVYLIQQRESDMLTFEKLERAKAEAELEALKNQLDPHFMFNSLNALSWLIENDPPRAVAFNDNLADVYRYILRNRDRALVSLEDELDFLDRYFALLKLRFEDAIHLKMPPRRADFANSYVPPISLQILIENAVKHNEFSRDEPLSIELRFEDGAVVVENEIRARRHPRPTSRVGLENLRERCRLTLDRELEVSPGPARFSVRLPVKSLH
ncbi:MAG: histidine kinase [Acidobacteria bacterium]|nr:histidine kinase [Acidobacteriota bacterium]